MPYDLVMPFQSYCLCFVVIVVFRSDYRHNNLKAIFILDLRKQLRFENFFLLQPIKISQVQCSNGTLAPWS